MLSTDDELGYFKQEDFVFLLHRFATANMRVKQHAWNGSSGHMLCSIGMNCPSPAAQAAWSSPHGLMNAC